MPPNFSDRWGNQYQEVTVQTAQGEITGQKASKKALDESDIGLEIEWNCEVKQDKRKQDYNKFTKLQDPQYSSQDSPQSPQHARQGTKAPQARDYDAENRGKVRTQFIKAAIIAGTLKCKCYDDVLTLTEFAMTGIDPTKAKPQYQANPKYVGDNPPKPKDDDIPF